MNTNKTNLMPRSPRRRRRGSLHRSLGRSLSSPAGSPGRPWVRADLGYRGIGGMNLTRALHITLPADSRRARFIFFCQRLTCRFLASHRSASIAPFRKEFWIQKQACQKFAISGVIGHTHMNNRPSRANPKIFLFFKLSHCLMF